MTVIDENIKARRPKTLKNRNPKPDAFNLIRTPDGRLAILDFGLMAVIDENIKAPL